MLKKPREPLKNSVASSFSIALKACSSALRRRLFSSVALSSFISDSADLAVGVDPVAAATGSELVSMSATATKGRTFFAPLPPATYKLI